MDGEDIIENPPDWEEVLERQRDGAPDVEEDEESDIVEPLMRQVPLTVDRIAEAWQLLERHVDAMRPMYSETNATTFFHMKR